MNDLVLKKCKLVNRVGEFYIGISDGKIAKISKQPIKADSEININDKLVLPGLIDPHVHFRDPGLNYKETFKTGSLAAANGGFTTVIDMPNTIPITNTKKSFEEKIKIGEKKSIIDFSLHAGFNNLEEMKKIAKFKPASFKIFMDLEEDKIIEEIFKNIAIINEKSHLYSKKSSSSNDSCEIKWKAMITTHCENKEVISKNTESLKKKNNADNDNNNDNNNDHNRPIDYSYARPSEAEDKSVEKVIDLSKKYNTKVHICHLSTKNSLKLLQKNPNLDITCEITPHHLLLTNDAFNKYGAIAKTNPPLRPVNEGLKLNDLHSLDMSGTDHAPHLLEEKEKGTWESSPGIPNLETTLPLLLTEVNKKNIDISLIPKILSQKPAEIFNLENKGAIEVNKDADLIIVDLKKEGKFDIDNFYTKAKYSPFENQPYKGIAIMTISNGEIIMENESVLEKNKGKYIPLKK